MRISLFLFSTIVCASATAGILTPTPGSALFGASGQTVGLGFDVVSSNSVWISFEASFVLFESRPVGIYTDFIGAQGGPTNYALPAGAPDWIESFDAIAQQGIGAYAIDPLSVAGPPDVGTIRVLYATYLVETPFGFISTQDFPTTQAFVDIPFVLTVGPESTPTPEPATTVPMLVVGCLLVQKRSPLNRRSPCRPR